MTDTEREALCARIDELCAENERLRQASLADENAKLRELVRDMFGVISRNNTWWDGNAKDTSRLSDRMRELGIGVA